MDKVVEQEKFENSNEANDGHAASEEDILVGWRSVIVVLATCWAYFGMIMIVIGAGFWRTAVAADIGGADVSLWASQSFSVVNCVLGPPLCRISDLVGRKWVILGACLFGVVGAVVMASAKSMDVCIAGATLGGVYWATVGSVSCIVSEVLPRRWRGAVQILLQFIGTLGVAVATLAGAKLVTDRPGGVDGWRIVFYLAAGTMGFTGVILALVFRPLPVPNPLNRSVATRIMDFDRSGTVLFAAALTPLLMGLIWGGGAYAWDSAAVVSTLTIGCVFLVVFIAHQIWYKTDGLFHHEMFKNRNFLICLIGLFAEGIVYYTFNNFFPGMVSTLYDPRPVNFALRYNVFIVGQLTGDVVFAYVAYKYRSVKPSMLAGYVLFLASVIGLSCANADQKGSDISIAMILLAGIGFAAPIALIQTVVQLSVPPEFVGVATALAISFRSLGGAFGTAIAGAVFTAKVNKWLPEYITKAALAGGLPTASLSSFVEAVAASDATAAGTVAGATQEIVASAFFAAKQAYAKSYHYVWFVQIPFLAVALGAVAMFKSVKEEMNEVVDRPVEARNVHAGRDDFWGRN